MKYKFVVVSCVSLLTNILQGSDPLLTPRTREILNAIGLQKRKNVQKSCESGKSEDDKKRVQVIFDKVFVGRDHKDARAELFIQSDGALAIKFVWPINIAENESWTILREMLPENKYEELLNKVQGKAC